LTAPVAPKEGLGAAYAASAAPVRTPMVYL